MKKIILLAVICYYSVSVFAYENDNSCRRNLRADSATLAYVTNHDYIEVQAPLYEILIDNDGVSRETKLEQVQIIDRMYDPSHFFGTGLITRGGLDSLYKKGFEYHLKDKYIKTKQFKMLNWNYILPRYSVLKSYSIESISLKNKTLSMDKKIKSTWKDNDIEFWYLVLLFAVLYSIVVVLLTSPHAADRFFSLFFYWFFGIGILVFFELTFVVAVIIFISYSVLFIFISFVLPVSINKYYTLKKE